MWGTIKRINGGRQFIGIEFLEIDENKLGTNDTDVANSLAEIFQLNSSDCNFSSQFPARIYHYGNQAIELITNQEKYNTYPILNTIVTEDGFKKTDQMKKDSSPGPDCIPNRLLKNLPQIGKNIIGLLTAYGSIRIFQITGKWLKKLY